MSRYHDLQKAVRKAYLQATLVVCTAAQRTHELCKKLKQNVLNEQAEGFTAVQERLGEMLPTLALLTDIATQQQTLNELLQFALRELRRRAIYQRYAGIEVALKTEKLLDDYTVLFVGRESKLAELDELLTAQRGVAAVAAPAGYGKTALLANWARLRHDDGCFIACHFKTLRLALNGAIKVEQPEVMAEMLLRHARKVATAKSPVLAWRQSKERAIQLAGFVFEHDHQIGTLWLLLLAWRAVRDSEREWAQRCLIEIRQRWEGKTLPKLGGWRSKLSAFLLSELGQVSVAIETAGMALEDSGKSDVAILWARRGNLDLAIELAQRIDEAWNRSKALSDIAKSLAELGDMACYWEGMGKGRAT